MVQIQRLIVSLSQGCRGQIKGGKIMMNSNLNLSALPECKFAYRMVNSALLIPCIEYQRMLRMEKVSQIAENF